MTTDQLTDAALQKALAWAEATEDFVAAQAPLVVDEIIRWGWVSYGLGVLIGLGLLAVAVRAAWILYGLVKLDRATTDDEDLLASVSLAVGATSLAIGLIVTLTNLYGLAYVWAAPRLYVIEQLTDLVGKGGG